MSHMLRTSLGDVDRHWRTVPSWIDVTIDTDRLAATSTLTLDEAIGRVTEAMRSRYPDAQIEVTTHCGALIPYHDTKSNARAPQAWDIEREVRFALGDRS